MSMSSGMSSSVGVGRVLRGWGLGAGGLAAAAEVTRLRGLLRRVAIPLRMVMVMERLVACVSEQPSRTEKLHVLLEVEEKQRKKATREIGSRAYACVAPATPHAIIEPAAIALL
jgi:hypothetical protein